jgi:hypothetical protein
MTLSDLDYVRSIPQHGARLYELFKQVMDQVTNLQQQVNGNPAGEPQPPPGITALKVSGANGHHSIAITDNSAIYRGIQYHLEHDTSPNFTNPQAITLGPSRNANLFLGSGVRYWRAASSYGLSGPSPWVYYGSQAKPTGVDAGGSVGPPATLASQGSGTGAAGVGLSGPGQMAFRPQNGKPPIR